MTGKMIYKGKNIPASSKTKAFEILCVLEEVKPTARLLEKDSSLKDWCLINGLAVECADHRLKLCEEKDKGYSNTGIIVGKNEDGLDILYIGKDYENVRRAKKAEEEGNHEELGRILGYPDCCCAFFSEEYGKELRKKSMKDSKNESVDSRVLDLTLSAVKSSPPFPFQSNVLIRCFDITLLFHFPCSLSCKKSINISEKHLSVLRKENEKLALEFVRHLSYPVVYSKTQGVHLLDSNPYAHILSSAETNLARALRKGNIIKNGQIFKGKELIGSIKGVIGIFQ